MDAANMVGVYLSKYGKGEQQVNLNYDQQIETAVLFCTHLRIKTILMTGVVSPCINIYLIANKLFQDLYLFYLTIQIVFNVIYSGSQR